MTPRVSLVIVAYQAERTIGAAISSALSQSYDDLEVIVVDDGSTDATPAIADAYGDAVLVVRQEHQGVATARNTGVAAARGELVTFCDSDDLLFERHVAALVEVFDRWHGGLVVANSLPLFPNGIGVGKRKYRGAFPRPDQQRLAILEQNFITIQTLFPRRILEDIGPFRAEKRRAEDWDFWMRAIYKGYRAALQPVPLALMRIRPDSLSADVEAMAAEVERILESVERELDLSAVELAYVERRRRSPRPQELGRRADDALRAGRYREAARLYRQAASLVPSERPLVWKARVISAAPELTGPIVRRRQLRLEQQLRIDEGLWR